MIQDPKDVNGFEISHDKESIRKAGDTKFIVIT